jgi:hypothetical protein
MADGEYTPAQLGVPPGADYVGARARGVGSGCGRESILGSVGLVEDASRIAAAGAAHARPDERVVAAFPIEPAGEERLYLCAFEAQDGSQTWFGVDEEGAPVGDRKRVRDAAAIAAMPHAEGPRVGSPARLDSASSARSSRRCQPSRNSHVTSRRTNIAPHYRLELI